MIARKGDIRGGPVRGRREGGANTYLERFDLALDYGHSADDDYFETLIDKVEANLAELGNLPAGCRYRVIVSLEIAVGFLEVGLFTLFILLVRLFRMRSRQYAFGIALGFGILAIGGLPSYLLLSEFGTKIQVIVYNAFPIVYIIAEMVWLLTFTRSEPPIQWQDSGSALDPEELITELRQYTRVAKGVLRR